MKLDLNIHETHDRLEHFKKEQASNLYHGVNDCLTKNKDCVSMQQHFPYVYIFAHPRTDDRQAGIKRMIWQPRLSKPKAQTNSYLFRALSKTDIVEIIWLLPPRELWQQFEHGKVTENADVMVSIANFVNHREELERPHKDDLTEDEIKKRLHDIARGQNIKLII